MSEETRWAPYGDEPPWEWLSRIARQAWRRLVGPPPEWTEADMVPEGAEPICPRCVLPHHPLAAICPHCGEIVSRWAPWMAYVWILVWGPALQRVVRQTRLSRLICLGLVVSGIGYVGESAGLRWMAVDPRTPLGRSEWMDIVQQTLWLLFSMADFAAGIRMCEAAARAWGSWRDAADSEDDTPAAAQ
jgi:hypothetical protein